MRFYELDGGAIRLDGQDTAQMTRAELRSNMGMVLQDTWLFGGTIRENILYGRPDATEDEILEAARATYVDRFVHSLPHGYDTVIDDEGGTVSAGEKQLLTIARAFLADPTILILDEATSSVDTRTEVLIQQAMAALRSNRTSFVIAHRLSTIRDADTILVMENGDIVEQGNHESSSRPTAPTPASTTRSSPGRPSTRSTSNRRDAAVAIRRRQRPDRGLGRRPSTAAPAGCDGVAGCRPTGTSSHGSLVGFGLAFTIGFERELRGSPAGDRTFGLIGASIAGMTAVLWREAPQAVAGAITGIGFIGVGVVLHGENQFVRGLTTAAAIFATAAMTIVAGHRSPRCSPRS